MLTLDYMGGREGQGKNDRMTQHGGGGDEEQSDNYFDSKCAFGYATSNYRSAICAYKDPKRVVGSQMFPGRFLTILTKKP